MLRVPTESDVPRVIRAIRYQIESVCAILPLTVQILNAVKAIISQDNVTVINSTCPFTNMVCITRLAFIANFSLKTAFHVTVLSVMFAKKDTR